MSPVAPRNVAVISVSMDLGAGRRGVDMGPSAIRIAGLNERLEGLGHTVLEVGTVHADGPEISPTGDNNLKYFDAITEVCERTRDLVRGGMDQGCFPLILGGDHSLSIGSVAAVAGYHRERGERIGVLWVDAHTDMNTPETSPSGNIHGMSLAVLCGEGHERLVSMWGGEGPAVDPKNVVVLGARDIDETEKEIVRRTGIRVITMSELDERGIAACIDEAIERLTDGTAGFHVSYDADGLDPMIAPGVGTPVPGGLTYREGHLVSEKVARSGKMLSFEMVEVNPVLDRENSTAKQAVGLIASALGQTIL